MNGRERFKNKFLFVSRLKIQAFVACKRCLFVAFIFRDFFFFFFFLFTGFFLAETAVLIPDLLCASSFFFISFFPSFFSFFFSSFFFSSSMDNGYDAASCTLRWDHESGSSTDGLLCLLREHASTLRQLRVA